MKLPLLVLTALVAVCESSYHLPWLPPCPYSHHDICPLVYPPPHECGVPGTGCYGYHEQCCRGPCYNECQVIHPYPPHHHPYPDPFPFPYPPFSHIY